jgi:hypothetical protein
MITSRWAVLLCKFADDQAVPPPLLHYQRLFTGVGAGSSNMVDYFRDMSHGQLDLSGSQVFGWFTLTQNRSAYAGNIATPPAGQFNRNGLFALCQQAALNNGVPLGTFDGTVVSMIGNVDLWGGPPGVMNAFCDTLSLSPSPLGQEMGHGYGLDHARQEGSEADYMDPWDVMSVYDSAFMAPQGEWGTIGPGLNAQCMRSRGWLDETRVWKASASETFETVLQLRPLHRRDLTGLLAAEVPGGFLVEYRQKERWDQWFTRSAVLVHSFAENHSYIMRGTSGNFDLVAGDSFQRGTKREGILINFSSFTKVEVVTIDEAAHAATIRLVHQAPFVPPSLVAQVLVGITGDGPGLFILGGKLHRVPPRGLAEDLVANLGAYLDAGEISNTNLRTQVQREALGAMTRSIESRMSELGSTRSPAINAQRENE